MARILAMISHAPELAAAAQAAIVEPRASANRVLLRRAIDRGEIPADSDVENLALISQSMAAYRVLIVRPTVDREFFVALIDGIVLPAVGIRPPTPAPVLPN